MYASHVEKPYLVWFRRVCVDSVELPTGFRRGGLTPACDSAHARKTGSNKMERDRRSDQLLPRGTVWY